MWIIRTKKGTGESRTARSWTIPFSYITLIIGYTAVYGWKLEDASRISFFQKRNTNPVLKDQIIPVDDAVELGRHWEYQRWLYWYADASQQSVGPVYARPPHCPSTGTHGSINGTKNAIVVTISFFCLRQIDQCKRQNQNQFSHYSSYSE